MQHPCLTDGSDLSKIYCPSPSVMDRQLLCKEGLCCDHDQGLEHAGQELFVKPALPASGPSWACSSMVVFLTSVHIHKGPAWIPCPAPQGNSGNKLLIAFELDMMVKICHPSNQEAEAGGS